MAFYYLTPVKGDIPIHLLETIVDKRLEYLKLIFKENPSVYNEYVVEGSLYDNVGHFMLCVICILGDNTSFTQFFLKSEIALFRKRLEALCAYDLRCFAKKLLRTIKKYEEEPNFLTPLQLLAQNLLSKAVAQHICTHPHVMECSVHIIQLNFKYCLSLVAQRQVELKCGVAFIPCGKWKQYLVQLFSMNLNYRLSKTNLTPLRSDPRIMELLQKIKKELFSQNGYYSNNNVLLSKEVDDKWNVFPPCMRNLHKNLRYKHRLSHSQRFYYSLFLKDIGMPIEEAIDFWKEEYRQHPNGHHSCCHNWEKDEKKYLYGIRHMYGLEGARKNYTSSNCKRIQNDISCSEGGCPFKSFDEPKMLELLPNCSTNTLSQIRNEKSKRQYTKACLTYLQDGSPIENCDNFSFNFTPVKYYMIASKLNLMEL